MKCASWRIPSRSRRRADDAFWAGLNRHDLGKLILAACFITDLGTVLALGGQFASYGWLLLVFVAVGAVTVLLLPALVRRAFR